MLLATDICEGRFSRQQTNPQIKDSQIHIHIRMVTMVDNCIGLLQFRERGTNYFLHQLAQFFLEKPYN